MKNKGFAALTTVLLSVVLASLAFITIQYGRIVLNKSYEEQLHDSCSLVLGKTINKSNNIENICSTGFLNNCAISLDSREPNFICEDLGLECDNNGLCKRKFSIKSKYNPNRGYVTKENVISVNEEVHNINFVDAAVIMLLDFSGSMRGNRIVQLKNAVRHFINENYNLSYSVILYNSSVLVSSNIGKGQQHNQNVLSIINSNNPGGGTNFVTPLNRALTQIRSTNFESYYIMLISDGSPNEGIGPSRNFVENNIFNINDNNCLHTTRQNPCITNYTLGVDNANIPALQSLSGNTLSQSSIDYTYVVNSQQTDAAFQAIIEEIMCKTETVLATQPVNVFNNLDLLEENVDYIYDEQANVFRFYDVEPIYACTEMLENNAQITLRWGKVELNVAR
tara:strand:+ start:117 stop:1298 length:1182 start_codon:yes stop_codon:yes gene_type:complete